MTDLKTTRNKHLTLETRIEIQGCLDHGMTFKAIGSRIGKDQTTISKEVKKHITVRATNCIKRNEQGEELPHEPCPLLLKAPFVCNPCSKRIYGCRKDKQFYLANQAQQSYKATLSEVRTGVSLNRQAFYDNDRIISNGVKEGQHLYHILQTHNLGVSKSSVYRYVNKGYLSISAIDLPRMVKFKPRKKQYAPYVSVALKIGRCYEDFGAYCDQNNVCSWVEMDTVIGRVGGKCILTFDFTFCNFMFGLLLDNKTAAEVSAKIIALKKRMAAAHLCFGSLFPVVLTDNGGEFADVFTVETGLNDIKETSLFFCDPNKAYQKPHVEKNHTLFRDILPKGCSFDDLEQDTVDLIFSHVNSVKRKQLNGKSPFELFAFAFGQEATKALGISFVEPDQVVQSPRLLSLIQAKKA
ncbi:MAG: IS30 family transposase [Clostridiales bacterium]|jgi:IS30 family transposase|nr:IS30 family transposase [Clostridiales bacterium]